MSTFLSRICSTGFLVLVLSACGGGGGGSGGGGDGSPRAQTQSTSITVIDGYIHGATVCVDKNSNGSCEPGETQGTTGPDGKVVLAIPLSDVGKFPIVAYVPAGAIDSDTGKAVGQAFTLKAPKDEHNVVTPLTTMVVHVLENDTSGTLTTTEAKAQVAQSTQIDPKVLMSDVSVIEDLSPRTLARTMAAVQKNRLSDLEAVSSCQATPAEKNKVIQAALNNAWSSIQTEIAKITECKNAKDQKTDACATAIDNAASVAIATTPGFRTQSLLQSLSSDSCSADRLPTASLNSSGRTDNLRPILNGTYSATLGNNYSIRVVNGNTDLGAATLNDNSKTWTFTPFSNLSYGSNSLSAVVVRNSDNLHGKASSVYNLKLGNSVSVSGNTSAGEEFTLTLNNLWDSVKSVVYTFAGAGSDMADGVVSQTANLLNNSWQSITTAFKTSGGKTVTANFMSGTNGTGTTLDTVSIPLTVTNNPVTQSAAITYILDGSTSVPEGANTNNNKPTISGTVTPSLGKYYKVSIYDGDSLNALNGNINYSADRKTWTFTPTTAFSQGSHALTAKVVRIDGTAETNTKVARNFSYSPYQLVNASPSSSYDKTECFKDSVTGLVWEGKTSTGARSGRNSYTNFDNTNLSQKSSTDSFPAPSDINSTGNTMGYVSYVNSLATPLCGFNDWRLPTSEELVTLLGKDSNSSSDFLGNVGAYTWTSSPDDLQTSNSLSVNSSSGSVSSSSRSDSWSVRLVHSDVPLTASIQTASNGNTSLSNGDRTDGTSVVLSGTYSATLSNTYSIHVQEGGKDWGVAVKDDSNKTWRLVLSGVNPGQHNFSAVVVRESDQRRGGYSTNYQLTLGNTISLDKNSPSVLDTINFSLSNVWSNIKSVVFKMAASANDLADGLTSKTAKLVNNTWDTVSTAFKSVAAANSPKTITVEFKDGANGTGNTIDTRTIKLPVSLGSVSQRANILNVIDDASTPEQSIASGSSTSNSQPLISVTVSEALNNFYSVKIYDAASNKLISTDEISSSGTSLTLRPTTALTNGTYRLKAVVSRFDGTQGLPGGEWNLQISAYGPGFTSSGTVGANAHIGKVTVQSASLANVASFECTIQPKPGTYSAPVKITWSKAALNNRQLISDSKVDLPVYGLYANYRNTISIKATLNDNTIVPLSPATITTPVGPSTPFDSLTVITSRESTRRQIGYDFFLSKGKRWSPIVLDTDGNVRWAYTYADSRIFTGPFSPESSAWYDNGFLVGGIDTLGMARIQLDGSFTYVATANFAAQNISTFHHNMEKGKAGYLALPNYQALPNTSTGNIESDVIEFNPDTGEVLKSWDLKKILTDYITSSGDTVKQFFYTPSWFRVNSAAYDPTDNGLVVSSRENFVIKLDYDTGKIRWIFGDPSKYWYTDFPSLRAKALTLNPGGIYPMGQNAVSITGQGKLLMFNNRSVSSFQPMGANEVNSDRSLVSYYSTDGNSKTATEIWQFDHPSKLYAPYCSSAYMANDKSMLILYSSATGRITGVDANKNIVFDYSYAGSNYCAESWNATPIPFGNLNFTR